LILGLFSIGYNFILFSQSGQQSVFGRDLALMLLYKFPGHGCNPLQHKDHQPLFSVLLYSSFGFDLGIAGE